MRGLPRSGKEMVGFVGFITMPLGQHHGVMLPKTAAHSDPRPTGASWGPEPFPPYATLLVSDTCEED